MIVPVENSQCSLSPEVGFFNFYYISFIVWRGKRGLNASLHIFQSLQQIQIHLLFAVVKYCDGVVGVFIKRDVKRSLSKRTHKLMPLIKIFT